MKRIFILTALSLSFLNLFAPQAAAQKRGPVVSGPAKKTVGTKLPTEVTDTAADVGTPPTILGTSGSGVYSLDPKSGMNSQSSTPKFLGGMSMDFVGIAKVGYTLYGLTSLNVSSSPDYRSALFSITPDSGASRYTVLNGWAPLTLQPGGTRVYCMGEGDLAYDRSGKSGGVLYATCRDGAWKLIAISPNSGAVTVKGTLPANGIFSALAFNKDGDLYTLDTHSRKLYKLDKNNAAVLQTIPLTGTLPNTSTQGGMGFADTGGLYAAFGGAVVSINVADGAVGVIRPTNYGSISGLVVWGGSGPIKHQ